MQWKTDWGLWADINTAIVKCKEANSVGNVSIDTLSLSCSASLVMPNRCFILWFRVYLHILMQKYLCIVPLNFVGLYISNFQQSNLLCCFNNRWFFLCNHLHCLVKRPFLSNSEKLITEPGEHIKAENNLYIGFGWFCLVCWFSVPLLVEHICFVIRGTCHMKEKENCITLLYSRWYVVSFLFCFWKVRVMEHKW